VSPVSDPWVAHPSMQTTPVNLHQRPASVAAQPVQATDPWSAEAQPAPPEAGTDPWGMPVVGQYGSTPSLATNGELDEFDVISTRPTSSKSTNNLNALTAGAANPVNGTGQQATSTPANTKKTPESFLGENSALVNLDALISSKPPTQSPASINPFASQTTTTTSTPPPPQQQPPTNAFQPPPRLTINQLRTQQQYGSLGMAYTAPPPNPVAFTIQPQQHTGPSHHHMANNPFL